MSDPIKTDAEKVLSTLESTSAKIVTDEKTQVAIIKAAKWWILAALVLGGILGDVILAHL